MSASSNTRASLIQRALTLSRKNLLDGQLVDHGENECFAVVDPATREPLGSAPRTAGAEIGRAVAAAKRSQIEWARMRPLDRGQLLNRAIDNVERSSEELAQLISLETGRPIRTETRPEVQNAIRILRYFAGVAMEVKGETIPYSEDVLALTIREPLGVVAAIIPWNVPAMLMSLKTGAALVCGNTVIVKSAEQSPLCTLYLGQLLSESLPPGVVQVLAGFGPDTGHALVCEDGVAKISFTGSLEAGKSVYGVAAERIIPVTLELGGKSPLIIFPDTEPELASAFAITGMRFSRQGQSCTSTTRIYVHESAIEPFVSSLVTAVSKMVIGDPLAEETEIGTIISPEQLERVQRYTEAAMDLPGTSVIQTGALPGTPPFDRGLFYRPTIVVNPPEQCAIVQEEIFGPIVAIRPWRDHEDLIRQANGTAYGLSACIVTRNLSDAISTARRLNAGYIQVNSGLVIQPGISFGGYKSSGLGRESSLESMLEGYTQVKTILIDHSRR